MAKTYQGLVIITLTQVYASEREREVRKKFEEEECCSGKPSEGHKRSERGRAINACMYRTIGRLRGAGVTFNEYMPCKAMTRGSLRQHKKLDTHHSPQNGKSRRK